MARFASRFWRARTLAVASLICAALVVTPLPAQADPLDAPTKPTSRFAAPAAEFTPTRGPIVPVVVGTRTVGHTLSVDLPSGYAYSYQWYRGPAMIAGATGATYLLAAADGGQTISVAVSITGPGYPRALRPSTATTPILRTLTSATPMISGVVRVGTPLTAVPGAWGPAPVTFHYQWSVDGEPVVGATGASFAPRPVDLNKTVSLSVTASKSGYESAAMTSDVSAPVALGVITLPVPTISGTAMAGQVLSAIVGSTVPSIGNLTLAYQWFQNGSAIGGATASTFTPDNSLIGAHLTVQVTASNPYYLERSATSAPTVALVGLLSSSVPVLTGTAEIDHTMCVQAGAWTPGTAFSYAWYLNTTKLGTTSNCVSITSASWNGMRLRVEVTGTKAGYAAKTVSSSSSAAIYVPNRTTPISLNSCPSWAPIKGNRDSWIYHMPGQRFYDVTNPEECFRTEAAAVSAGYRKAKV